MCVLQPALHLLTWLGARFADYTIELLGVPRAALALNGSGSYHTMTRIVDIKATSAASPAQRLTSFYALSVVSPAPLPLSISFHMSMLNLFLLVVMLEPNADWTHSGNLLFRFSNPTHRILLIAIAVA